MVMYLHNLSSSVQEVSGTTHPFTTFVLWNFVEVDKLVSENETSFTFHLVSSYMIDDEDVDNDYDDYDDDGDYIVEEYECDLITVDKESFTLYSPILYV